MKDKPVEKYLTESHDIISCKWRSKTSVGDIAHYEMWHDTWFGMENTSIILNIKILTKTPRKYGRNFVKLRKFKKYSLIMCKIPLTVNTWKCAGLAVESVVKSVQRYWESKLSESNE